MSLVGTEIPEFQTKAVCKDRIYENFCLSDYAGKYVIFFFYPLDFTFVCPTELHAFQDRLREFEQRGAQVVGCSIDSCFSHLAWLRIPKEQGGIAGITYPLVSDIHKSIAMQFQALNEEEGIAYRALFLIDRKGVIRHQLVNDLPLGRSVDEVLRLLDALIFHETHGEVCPANWKQGDKSLLPTAEGVAAYFSATLK